MSNFEDNPFGEPQLGDPFADPSIQQVATNTTSLQRGLEDYSPFEGENLGARAQAAATSQPATLQPSTQSIPSAAPSVTQISTAELQRKQEELERKAAELDRREQELRNSTASARPNNWPPLPAFCPFQPCFYHDIQTDIPSEFQRIVLNLYRLWIFYAILLIVNILGGLVIWFNGGGMATFAMAIFYSIILTPASFLCWYRPAYKAFQKDSSFNFMVFFFIFFFQMCVTVIQTIGIHDSGYCGFITALYQFNGQVGGVLAGIFCLMIAVGFGAAAAGNLLMISKIHSIYRSSGASMAKAQAEFQSEFFRNQHVQNAAADVISSSINNNRNRY